MPMELYEILKIQLLDPTFNYYSKEHKMEK